MKRLLVGMIRFYKKYISSGLPPSCKYHPTCSQYAIDALERFGAVRGTILAAWRILRCNPFSRGGFDPIPEHFCEGKQKCGRKACNGTAAKDAQSPGDNPAIKRKITVRGYRKS